MATALHDRTRNVANAVGPLCSALARLIDGSGESADSTLAGADATLWFQRNKYPLVAVSGSAPGWLRDDPIFQRALAADQEWYATQRNEYALVQQAWLAQGIVGIMIKSAGNPPSFPYASDNIDVEVRPEHGAAARAVLRGLGYVDVRSVEEPRKFLFRKFHAGRSVSAIHVHECVGWGVGFMDEDALWKRMRAAADDPLVNIPSAEDAILINLAHACYENKRLRLIDIARVRHVLRTSATQLDWDYMTRVTASRGWLDGLAFLLLVYAWLEPALFGSSLVPDSQLGHFEALIRNDRPIQKRLAELRATRRIDLPLPLSYWFCKRLYYRKILADPALTPRARWRDVGATLAWGIKLKAHQRPQPGAIISLSGPDGSGKTAHATALSNAFRQCGIHTDYVWSRGGSTGLLSLARPVARLVVHGRLAESVAGTDALGRRRRRLAATSPLARGAWAWLVALDQVGFYMLKARLPSLAGRVVVTDRYAYDAAVDMDLALPEQAFWSRLAIAAMLRLVPRPRFGYVLELPPQSGRVRNKELSEAGLDDARQRYRALGQRFGLRVLPTAPPFVDVNDPWVREVIMVYMAQFETWLNGIFRANPSQLNHPDPVWAAMDASAR